MFHFGRRKRKPASAEGVPTEVSPTPADGQEGVSPTGKGSSSAGNLRRLSMRFVGEVQGVGFRWTSQACASKVGCTGWVHNEYDGSVTMELQGTDDQISQWFGRFSDSYARYPINYRIDKKDDIEPIAGEDGFAVHF